MSLPFVFDPISVAKHHHNGCKLSNETSKGMIQIIIRE